MLKWYSVLQGFILRVELSAVIDLWAVPVVWPHCRCNQKRFSQPNLYHRGNYHKVHGLLIFSCLLLLLVGWSNLCPSCRILRQNLYPAKHPIQPGQARWLFRAAFPAQLTACSTEGNLIRLFTPPAEPAYTTAGITVLWLRPKTTTVTESLEFVVCGVLENSWWETICMGLA